MKNLLQKRKQRLFLLTLLLTSTTLPLKTAFADDSGNLNNNSSGSSLTTAPDSTPVAPLFDGSSSSNPAAAIDISFVTVGDPGNAPDYATKLGAVSASFQIGKYPVTAQQYAVFLNSVASIEDSHGLYHPQMESDKKVACITRSTNDDGTFSYDVIAGMEKLPITYVSLHDAERFCNWLENGAPTPASDAIVSASVEISSSSTNPSLTPDETYIFSAQSTERGAYNFSIDANGCEVATANPNASYFLPSQDEWVKAAYYKGNGTNSTYCMYPTQHDTAPSNEGRDVANLANYETYGGRPPKSDFLTSSLVITEVDCFNNTASFYNVCDMAGNVAEWTTDTMPSGLSLIRGGSWASKYSWYYDSDLMIRAIPKGCDPSVGTNFIGFRVAAAAEALTVSLAEQNFSESSALPSENHSLFSELTPSFWNKLTPAEKKLFITGAITTGTILTGTTAFFYGFELLGNMYAFDSIGALSGLFPKAMNFEEAWSKFTSARNLINTAGLVYGTYEGGEDAVAGENSKKPEKFTSSALQTGLIALEVFVLTSGLEVAANTFGFLEKAIGFEEAMAKFTPVRWGINVVDILLSAGLAGEHANQQK